MSKIYIPSRNIQANFKPDYPVELDPKHPLTRNTIAYYTNASNSGGQINLANGSYGAYTSDVGNIIGSLGRGVSFSGGTAGINHYPAFVGATNGTFTILARVVSRLSGTTQNIIDCDNYPSSPRLFQFRQAASNAIEFITFDASAAAYTLDGGTIPLNTPVWVAASVSGTNTAVWINTAKTTGTMTSPQVSSSATTNGTTWWVGESKIYSGAQPLNGIVYEWMVFNSVPSDSEIISLQQNPYQLLRPKRKALHLTVGSPLPPQTYNPTSSVSAGWAAILASFKHS